LKGERRLGADQVIDYRQEDFTQGDERYDLIPSSSTPEPGTAEIMTELKKLLEAGRLTPVIDRTFPLSEARAAMRYMQDGGGLGKILITPQ